MVCGNHPKANEKIMPDMIKMFAVPLMTLLICVPVSLLAIGPVANGLSAAVGHAFTSVYRFSPVLYGTLLGGFWQVLVMFGLHWGLVPLALIDFAQRDARRLWLQRPPCVLRKRELWRPSCSGQKKSKSNKSGFRP